MSYFESNSFLICPEFVGDSKIYSCNFYIEINPENYFTRQRPYQKYELSSKFLPVQLNYSLFAEPTTDPFTGTRYENGTYVPNPASRFVSKVSISDKSGLFFSCEAEDINNSASIYSAIRWKTKELIYNPCTEYELLCDSEYYPGWECVPIEPIANRLNNIRNEQQREPRL